MRDSDSSNDISNPFVRWKQHVNYHIGSTLNSVLGIPSVVMSKSYSGDGWSGDSGGSNSSSSSSNNNDSSGRRPPPNGPVASRVTPDALLMRQWYNWAVHSPYSPWNLQYMPQPRPRDLPADMAYSPNGYADAFEDLLRETSGHGGVNADSLSMFPSSMMDHHKREDRTRQDRAIASRNGVDPRVLWLAELRAQGVLGAAYAPGSSGRKLLGYGLPGDAVGGARGPLGWPRDRTRDVRLDWLRSLREQGTYDYCFPQQRAVYEGRASNPLGVAWDAWSAGDWPAAEDGASLWDWKDTAKAFTEAAAARSGGIAPEEGKKDDVGRLFDELDRVFKSLGLPPPPVSGEEKDKSTPFTEGEGNGNGYGTGSGNGKENTGNNAQPQTEEDIISFIHSSLAESEKSLSVLIRSIARDQEEESRQDENKNKAGVGDATSPDALVRQQPSISTSTKSTTAETRREPGRYTSTETTNNPDGTKTIMTREEHVDRNGNRRSISVVTRTLDADGNEISVQTERSMRSKWEGSWSWPPATTGSNSGEEEQEDEQQKKRWHKSGDVDEKGKKNNGNNNSGGSWFWK